MWQRIKSLCLHSVTMAVGYVIAAVGTVLELVLDSADILNGGDFKAQLSQTFSDHPALVSRTLLVISVLVVLARLRSLMGWGMRKENE
jgi:uncharacterized membrane protein YczE